VWWLHTGVIVSPQPKKNILHFNLSLHNKLFYAGFDTHIQNIKTPTKKTNGYRLSHSPCKNSLFCSFNLSYFLKVTLNNQLGLVISRKVLFLNMSNLL